MAKPPDRNTLCRAFDAFVKPALARSAPDLMAELARRRGALGRDAGKPLAVDSSLFESRHVSRHVERRRRETAARAPAKKSPASGAEASTGSAAGSRGGSRSSR